MDIITLCRRICLQEELIDSVVNFINENKCEYMNYAKGMTDFNIAEKMFIEFSEKYNGNKLNTHILAVYMLSCLYSYEKYQELGISDDIFNDTMKCFTRFVSECTKKTGECYFDRGFWTYRQTALQIFRIGELEYELVEDNGTKLISIHIPSDAILTKELIEESVYKCRKFMEKHYPDYTGCEYVCGTWLLSPNLRNYLNEGSRILQFQSFFKIKNFNQESKDFIDWLFMKDKDYDITMLPENTSLQRNVKKALLEGNKIGSAYGTLII